MSSYTMFKRLTKRILVNTQAEAISVLEAARAAMEEHAAETHPDSSMVNTEHSLYKREVARFESRSGYHNGVAQLAEQSPESKDGGQVGGSIPSPVTNFKARWREELKCQTGVYVRRWYIETPLFSARVHHWLHSDDSRNFHDHPWWFVTFVFAGGYTDVSPSGSQEMQAPKIAFRPALHRHTVQVKSGGAWTLLITGPKIRNWGFWVKDKFKKANKYFFEHGVHSCD